ncbi:Helix-turn-helix domain-containing protein [Limimonas halophila]|uniref:Helix-turn-helix domain-containing protein n=1 Tax=Limimonas halophila TaxID=1082479 RepID=A0A1G7RY44_9PROT|nr:helix-turn-helix transcriptional regulator [Limimonas halophila]SDG14730.1 Helix-turn-helix domain-containing protein [Limimonas halophila]
MSQNLRTVRPCPPETERIADHVRALREGMGLSRAQAAEAVGFRVARVRAFEEGWAGVPTLYVGRLLRLSGVSATAWLDALFAPAAWPRDPRAFDPLPADARSLECALRLWRTEPDAARASLSKMIAAMLDRVSA